MRPHTMLLISAAEPGWRDLRTVIQAIAELRIVGETRSACQALHLAMTHAPDVILSAAIVEGVIAMPLLRGLRRALPASKIVVLATRVDLQQMVVLKRIGVEGYLVWRDLPIEVIHHCLAAILLGDIVLTSRVVRREGVVRLSPREQVVLGHLAAGLTQEAIARAEGLSRRTVQRIVADLEAKLHAPSGFVLGLHAAFLELNRGWAGGPAEQDGG